MTEEKGLQSFKITPRILFSRLTVSFYFKTDGHSKVGILSTDGQYHRCEDLISILADGRDLIINTFDGGRCKVQSSQLRFPNVFKPNEFTFVAITFDRGNSYTWTVYNDAGDVLGFSHMVSYQTFAEEIDLGIGWGDNREYTMSTTHALACVALYNTILTAPDIAALPCACHFQA